MKDNGHSGKQDQLEEHSLPGTNQAGKGPDAWEKGDHRNGQGGSTSQHQTHLEEHSLPGTNQAGKGPASDKEDLG